MARPLRIEFEGAYYHILSRGNNQAPIFKGDKDYWDFLDLLGEMTDRFSVRIFAYVLMGNHYHLLIQTRQSNLSKAMQWLGTSYTRRFNIRNKQSGHLFQGRFKSILVESDAYFTNLSCYIHRNPLRAGIVKRLADYKWSSYPFYAYQTEPPGWVDVDPILAHFGKDKDRHLAYRKCAQTYSDEDGTIWEDIKFGFIYGSQNFIDRIKDRYLSPRPISELPELNKLLRSEDPDKLLNETAQILNCDINEIMQSRRLTGKMRDKRDMVAWILWVTRRYSNRQIGHILGMNHSSISRRLRYVRKSLNGSGNNRIKTIHNRIKTKIKV